MSSTQLSYKPEWADRPPDFYCKADADGPGFVCVSLSGELDLATAPKLGEALAEVPDGSTSVVILDLSGLTFIDSTGLHVIVNAATRLAEAGCRLVLIPGDHQVQRIFEITGTKHHLEFVAAPDARDLAIVPLRTEAFLHAHLSLRQNANDIAFGADDPSELAQSERPSAKHSRLNSTGVHRDGSQSPLKGQAPDSRRPHARFAQ